MDIVFFVANASNNWRSQQQGDDEFQEVFLVMKGAQPFVYYYPGKAT